jgi:hypothetical protein
MEKKGLLAETLARSRRRERGERERGGGGGLPGPTATDPPDLPPPRHPPWPRIGEAVGHERRHKEVGHGHGPLEHAGRGSIAPPPWLLGGERERERERERDGVEDE